MAGSLAQGWAVVKDAVTVTVTLPRRQAECLLTYAEHVQWNADADVLAWAMTRLARSLAKTLGYKRASLHKRR